MVYKLVAGVAGKAVELWNQAFPKNEFKAEALNTNNDFKHHYKNRIVQKWNLFHLSEVKALYLRSQTIIKGPYNELLFTFCYASENVQTIKTNGLVSIITK